MKQNTSSIADIVNNSRHRARPAISPGKRYLLYGAGKLGRIVLRALQKAGVEVAGFLDQGAAERREVEGVRAWLPDSDEARKLDAECDGVIVTVYNHHANLRDIFLALNRFGYQRLFSAPDLARALPKNALRLDYWLDLADEVPPPDQLTANLEQAYALLSDDASRELFLELVTLRLSGDYTRDGSRIHAPALETQYFPQDLPTPIDARRMIDCGAYDGDSLRAAQRYSPLVERIACFEPDPQNFRKLVENVRAASAGTEAELFPLAVWNKNAVLSFASSQDAGSAVSTGASATETHIQAVTLDDALGDFRPTLIKMDIEGAEPEALKGAVGMIQTARPQLAICVYHKFNHYWQIPLFIDALKCGYRLYLRQHGYNGQETVLYALPQ
jgi:FkbM family methyltransferase